MAARSEDLNSGFASRPVAGETALKPGPQFETGGTRLEQNQAQEFFPGHKCTSGITEGSLPGPPLLDLTIASFNSIVIDAGYIHG